MEKPVLEKDHDFKIPKDIPEGFFDIVSDMLSFIENVDHLKNKGKE